MKRLVLPLVCLVLVTGCSGLGDDEEASGKIGSPAGSPAGSPTATDPGSGESTAREAPEPELQEFYDQRVDWQPCEDDDDFGCARIEVPLDYEDPSGERIELALLKNPADRASARIGSLVVNPGGPGAPGTSYASSDEAWPPALANRYDIVGFDPRGTGTSTAIDCLSDRELDAYIASDPDPDNAADVREFTGWVEKIGEGCAEKSGDLAAHVSTHEAARDMDVIRAVLGEEKLTYFGASYGTKLGATYAELFPEQVGRFVLDGAVDVSLTSRQGSLQQARGFEVALTAYIDDCVAGGECYLGDTREQAKATIKEFLTGVEAEPLDVGDRQLKVGNAFYGLVAPLYNQEYWKYLDDGLGDALDGDGEFLLLLSDFYTSRNSSGGYDDNSSEAIYAINCLDDPTSIPASRVPSQYAAFDKASPTFGRVFAWGLTGCSGLAVEAPDNDWDLDAAGADPLLVIGTTRDPATPLRWAKALAAQLDPAILVTRDGDGHTGYNMKNPCVDDVVESYLLEGEVPGGDVDCPAP